MSLSNRSISNSPAASILLKAKRFGIFSIFTLTAIIANPLLVKAQIAVDGSTATEVKGNTIAPVGQGTVNGGNLYHSFDKFNVPNSGVIFNTGNSSVDGTRVNNIINRVTGDTPSSILGTIESRSAFPNANLYLLNPNGVVFGANARLDIGGSFNVTTGTSLGFDQNQKFSVDKNSLSFPSSDPKNIQFAIAQPAAIINQGNLTVDAGKNISITAGTVVNTGSLTAPNGNINVAAVSGNSQVELRSPDLVLGFAVNKDVIPSNWNGTIATLPKLAELLTGQAAQANQVVVKPDGTIALVASPSTSDIAVKDGMNIASGKIDVSSSTGKGGNIGVFGNQVGLVNALIDASGTNGGGTVLIGGDLQGKGTIPNALQTYVDVSSKILANGLLVGDGGKVIVWADRSTQFFGAIAARGGDVSGNGGFVEVSGKQNLNYQGSTDTLAPFGKIGTLLLDPQNITVTFGSNNPTELITNSVFSNLPATSTIANSTINAATANVVLQATQNINFNAPINITASGVGLTAQAGNSIVSDGFGNGTITTNGGNVSLTANDPAFATGTGNINLGGNITTNGGDIKLAINNAGRLTIESTAQLKSGSGNITLESKTTTGTNSGISIKGNIVVGATPSTGAILIDASSTSLDAVNFGPNSQVISDAGLITINGISATANGIRSVDGVRIQSTTGAINLTGISNGGTGDGVLLQGGNTIAISNNGSSINISGNAVNSANTGLNLTGTALTIGSGTGNLTFTSDRSLFPNTPFAGSGTITLQPFSNNSLVLNSGVTNVSGSTTNVFADSSFFTTLAASPNFSSIVIGNATTNNPITVASSLTFNKPTTIQTPAGNGTINTSGFNLTNTGGALTLLANQNITTGNITARGNAIAITSTSGAIDTSSGTIDSRNFAIAGNGGNISYQALGDIKTGNIASGLFGSGNAGLISLTSTSGSIDTSSGLVDSRPSAFATGNSGNISYQAFGNITTSNVASSSNSNGGLISLITTNGSIDTSLGLVDSSAFGATGNAGNISYQALGNIKTADMASAAFGNGNGGLISLITTNGSINLAGSSIDVSSNTGIARNLTFGFPVTLSNSSLTINTVSNSGTNGSVTFSNAVNGTAAEANNLTINSGSGNIIFNNSVGSNTTPLGSLFVDSTGTTRFNSTVNAANLTTSVGGTTELNGNITTSGTQTFNNAVSLTNAVQLTTTNSAIAFNNLVNGARNLTVSTGTGNITFAGAVGNLQPLLALTTTSTGTITFTNPVIASSITSNSGTTVINGNLTANGVNGNGISLRNFTINGNVSLIGDELNLLGTGSGTGNLSIAPFTSGQAIAIGGAGETTNTTLDLTATDIAALSGGTFSSLTIGNSLGTSAITLAGNANFAQPTTIQSPVGNGTINTSGFNLTNTGGSITLLANQNITTGNITAAGKVIALTSSSGAINTSAGRVSTATSLGSAGSISFQAFGDITTGSGTTPNPAIASFITTGGLGTPNSISFTSSNGAINTSLGDIDAGGGNITFTARNNITTSGVFSRAFNGGTISLTSQAGVINTSAGDVVTTTTDSRGTGGNITLTANGNVTTKGVFATGDDGKIEITSSTGGIDTTTGASSLASIGANNSITLTAQQNILTRDIFASGQNTSLSITSNAGLINTSLGTLNTSGTTGDAGNISLNAGTSSIIGNLNASSTVGNAGAIAFNISGNTTLTGSEINVRSASGTASNIDFNGSPVILNTPSLVIDTSGGGNSGNVTFSGNLNGTTANVNNLSINAGAGDISFEQIGNTVPLGFITISTSGTTIFNTVRAGSIQTLNGGSGGAVNLLGNITTNGNIAFDGAASVVSNIVLNSSAGNGPIFFNGAIANNVSGTPSNITLNAGTGNIEINQGVGRSGDLFGNITVANAGNFSTGGSVGESIFANSFTQLAGTGRTNFGGNDNFTGSVTVTTDNVSVDEGATLIASNVRITALNGFRANTASRLEVTGNNETVTVGEGTTQEVFSPGSININADSNSDGVGVFSNRGTITDGGLGGSVSVRAASLDIRGSIIAKNISLIPSTNAPTIAIGSAATGTFRLEDTAISFLNATDLVSIAANNGNVNIGSTQAFNTGTSLEIGTTASPANNITSATGSNLSVNKNLSATGTAIALGNATVGGDLTVKGNNIVFGNTTAGNLTVQLNKQVSQAGTITVAGQTNFIIDTNPLTNLLLADFANNFGSAITLSFANLSTTSFNNLEFRTVNVGAQFNVAPQQVNNLKLILDNGTIALPSVPLTGSLTLSAKDVSVNGNITATTANLSGGNVNINSNLTTTAGDLAIANSGLLTVKSGVNLDIKGNLIQSGTGSVEFGGNIGNSTSVGFTQPITLIGNSIINSGGNVTFTGPINGARSLTVNTGGITLFNRAIGETTPLTDITTDSTGTTQINGNVITSGSQNFNDRLLISSNSSLDSSRGNGNINLGVTANAIAGTPSNLTLNTGQGNIVLTQVGSTSDPFGNITIINAGNVSTGSLDIARNLSFTANTIAFGNTTVAGNLAIAPTTKVSQTGTISVTGTTSFILNQSRPDILLANFNNNIFNGGVSFLGTGASLLALSAKDISLNGAVTALSANLTGGNITINDNVTTTSGNLTIANSGTFRLNPNANLDLKGNLLLSGGGTTAIGGNITRSNSIDFVQPVSLISNSSITSNGNITFERSVNGAFALNLDTNGNFVNLRAAIGDTTPLTSFAIATNTTLSSRSNFETTASTFNPIQISTTGNISVGAISNSGANVTLKSSAGVINTGDINTSASQTGGQIFIDASQAINVGILNSSGSIRAGDVTLDPVGDVVVRAIDASSTTQGGNVTLVSTGGNLRITDTLLSSTNPSCIGASICTSGGTGGNVSLQTGGLNPFLVDDATLNGSKGVLTTGTTTVNLGTSIPVILSSSFIQGEIKVTPGGIITLTPPSTPTPTPTPTDSKQPFVPPEPPANDSTTAPPSDDKKPPVTPPPEFSKDQAGRYLDKGDLPKAFDALERSYTSELETFVGRPLNLSAITINDSQNILTKVAQQTGDVAALIYPVLLDNRIEIMVVPPKDKGKPFRKFTVVASKEAVEGVLTDYRNNIRDVGSNDYLEQSQKLYDLIMRPIDSQLKAMKINTLVFVMDAGLRVVPPAAMHDGKQFVVERYGVASVASMRVTNIEERDRKSTRILAMGLTDSVSGFSALPSVDVEIKTIASNALEGASFLNKDFTVSNLQAQRQLGKYSILHLGTHGKFVSDNSGESFIQFWDSRLSLSQIPKLRFDNPAIDMLTLSACQTAVGNNLGISGLAVESGAKSVLASLWEVSDAGTAPLMISFYKAFPNAINKAQAMQQAQLSLLSGKVSIKNGEISGILGLPNIKLPIGTSEIDLSHPFYWSSFILVGNWL